MGARRRRTRVLHGMSGYAPGASMRAMQAMLRSGPPLTTEDHRRRRVTCGCGWCGTVSQLRNLRYQLGEAGMPGAACGPSFPVCPECHSDRGMM
jgi:hypothetical protein